LSLLNPPETHRPEQSNLKRRFQGKIVFLSPRGGAGKSSFIANIAASLALRGHRIGIVDLDIKGPSLGAMFNIRERGLRLNDFLLGRCSASSCVIDLTKHLNMERSCLFLLPASLHTADILAVYDKGYSLDELVVGLTDMAKDLKLDLVLIDTHSGLDEDALISMAISDHAVVLSRLDRQNHLGMTTTITALRKLGYGERGRSISLIINNVPPTCDPEEAREEFERAYGYQVLAVVPFYMEVLTHVNKEIFFLKEPSHPFSAKIAEISEKLLNRFGS